MFLRFTDWIEKTFVFWSELNSSSFLLVQGLYGLNKIKLDYDGPDDY